MKNIKKLITVVALQALCISGASAETYEPNWDSLQKHEAAPEWLKDAKLGIYFHWGLYSVPAFGNEWYPSRMYNNNSKEYRHHVKTYGDPEEFGFHDFIPMFKGEHFDPEEWADLFQKSGARFAGPVAEHHDGYSMWASKLSPWNAKETGPKRDVLGELFASLRKRDMKTIATFHHSRNIYGSDSKRGGGHYSNLKTWPAAYDEPNLKLFYGKVPATEWYEDIWLGKLVEVIDTYQPDAIWFDSWLDTVPETYRQRFCAYYLNEAEKWDEDVAIIRKQSDLPIDFTVNDHEKSREPEALPELWLTDDTISTGSWCYTRNVQIKPTPMVVHALVDTVSKNGVTFLNISPKANGEIPDDQRKVLLELGGWLKLNGEAIYDTRPWVIAAEGPSSAPTGGYKDKKAFLKLTYSEKDVRYTVSKDGKTVYAILLGVPAAGAKVVLKSIADAKVTPKTLEMLNGTSVEWEMTPEGAEITLPSNFSQPNDTLSCVFKIGL